MMAKRFCSGVVAVARREIERIATSGEYRAVVWWLPLAVILFFAIFFSQEVVGVLPVAVVDEDDTPLSRKVVSMIRATPQTALVCEMPDMETARNKVLQGDVVAVVEIPNGFSKSVLSGETANVVFYDSGANISTNSLAAKGVQTALTTFGVGVSLQRAEMRGAAPDRAMAQAMPIAFTTYGLFNPWLNYAYYVAPCFWAMILIIAAVLSTIYAVGTELRYATSVEWLRSANNSLVAALMGKLAPTTISLWLLSVVIGALVAGLVGGVGNGSNLSYCRLSGGCSLYCGFDRLDAFVVIARRGLFGLGIYIFGRNIPHNGDAFDGATIHHVIPIYLFYAPLYRPSGARLEVVALNVGLGGNVAILSAPVDTFRKIEKHFSET